MPKKTPAKRKTQARSAPAKAKKAVPPARPSRTAKPSRPVPPPSRAKVDAPKSSANAAKGNAKDLRVGVVRAVPAEPPRTKTFEERTTEIEARLAKADADFLARYRESVDMSWIHHDSALEGVVYTLQELRAAIDPQAALEVDSSLQPITEEIRRHREAIDFIRDYATKPKQPITVDTIKQIFLILHPEEGDLKTVKYRKEVPQHRLYFHEYATPDKIAYKVRQVVDWIHDPETKKSRNSLRIAARAHYDLLRVFPFAVDSGKVARLFMNLLLLRSGLPPAIVHSTERQRYYDALKGSSNAMNQIVAEAIENNLASIEKLMASYEGQQSAARSS